MNNTKSYFLFTDGGSRGNPGPAATGVVLMDESNNVIATSSTYIGETTNNQAEYQALVEGLMLVAKKLDIKKTQLTIKMDSELIVKQIKGEYKVRDANLRPHFETVIESLAKLKEYSIMHIPREKNYQADALVNRTLDSL